MRIFALIRIKLQEKLTKLYVLVWGQWSDSLKAELYIVDGFVKNSKTYDMVWLFSNVKRIAASINKPNNVYARLFQNIKWFFAMKQQHHEITDAYFKFF